ncbi:hypothetical protein [Brevibacillus laterosporus]|uniref:hypothetical protein n=1 Tax=Brevibacillus laterosporus TaxID=1465 RepID=UPI0003B1CA0E|nr:hypothetical protein P615_14090 [Brevibacillus laterosporus PE36]
MLKLNKQQRIEIVNRIIKEISHRGRGFFYSKDKERTAYFVQGERTLWFIDEYTGIPIKMVKAQMYNDRGFSHGGTLWGLVNDFKDFINGDDDANHNNGYGGLYCPHWGYPEEDMEAIQKYAIELGYLKST